MKGKLILLVALMCMLAISVQAGIVTGGASDPTAFVGTVYDNETIAVQNPVEICAPDTVQGGFANYTAIGYYTSTPGVDYEPTWARTYDYGTTPTFTISGSYAGKNITQVTACTASGYAGVYSKWWTVGTGSRPATALTADFYASNVSGTSPFSTTLYGVTTAVSPGYNWSSSGPGALTLGSPTGRNTTVTGTIPGSYSITLSVVNATGSGTITKNNYLTITGANSSVIRTYFQAVDGSSGGAIHGANLQIKDVTSGIWANSSADADGTYYIDTLASATINAYSDYTGYQSVSRLGLSPFDGVYELVMWPTNLLMDPGTGNINLIILVNDKATSAPINLASVAVTTPSGATTGQATNEAGSTVFAVPNGSVINIKVTASGYQSASTSITTTSFGPDTKRVELQRVSAVTPTGTIPGDINHDGVVDEQDVPGATPVPTLDARTDSQKDDALMAILRNNAESILWLCILAIIFGLLKMIMRF